VRTAEWRAARRAAAARYGPSIQAELLEAAQRAWGGQMLTSVDPDLPAWRVHHYLGSAGPRDHRYLEVSVTATIDPEGRLVAYQVDNGAEFLALHDLSDSGLRRGLRHVFALEAPERSYSEPLGGHRRWRYGEPEPPAGLGARLRRLLRLG